MKIKVGDMKEIEINDGESSDEGGVIEIRVDRITIFIRENYEGISFRSYNPDHKMRISNAQFFHLGVPNKDRPDLREIEWSYKK